MNCLIYSALSHFEKLYVSITYFCQKLKALKNIFVSFIAFCILGFSGGVNIVKQGHSGDCGDEGESSHLPVHQSVLQSRHLALWAIPPDQGPAGANGCMLQIIWSRGRRQRAKLSKHGREAQ